MMATIDDEMIARQTWEACCAYRDELDFIINSLQVHGFEIEFDPTETEGTTGYDDPHRPRG